MERNIPTDQGAYNKIVQQVSLRMQASADYYAGKRDAARRAYERWHRYPARPQTADDRDDYEIQLGYGFGIVEQIISKITEPLMNMGIPFGVFPTEQGDQPKSDNFADICRDFYSKPNVQMGKRKSKKEMGIIGWRWEVDEWLHVQEDGQKWGEVDKEVEQAVIDPDSGEAMMDGDKPAVAKMSVKVVGEVPCKITTFYGFNTRYPSYADMYPEPKRTTIDTGQATDVSWLVEDMSELALEDLCRQVTFDPATKKTIPRYDFKKMLAESDDKARARYANIMSGASSDIIADAYGPVITPVRDWVVAGSEDKEESNASSAAESFEDRDKIWVVQMRTKNEIVTIAQGKYIIERVIKPWHRPRIGARVEVYTIDPRSLLGIGALDPVMDELDELDITHSLGMQNLFRLVNKMIAVKVSALVSIDDMDPRAGGLVRINDEVESVGSAVQAIQTPSAINEMLAGESNTKGAIETVVSVHDGQPGVQGTKAFHKTARGKEILENNLQTRFATMQAQGLINEALSGQSMEYFFAQFQWEAVSYRCLQQDGSTVYSKFTKDDIDTEGRGFRYLITVDPLWGNTHQQRQDAIEVFQQGVGYEELRLKSGDPAMKKVDLSILFEDLLKKSGRRDTSKIFALATGEVSPEQELQILIGGGVVQGCKGDKQHHIEVHILQAKAPNLAKAIEAGKADPQTIRNLHLLIAQAKAEMITFLQAPEAAAAKRLDKAGMSAPAAMPEGM